MDKDRARRLLIVLSLFLFAVRFVAAKIVGFGDSEALYACYALHPAPAYLDHPGLVGNLARALAGGAGAPSPYQAHVATALLATLVPWLVFGAARAAGATAERSVAAALVTAVTPEIAVGLFAMTPDLLLAIAWLLTLGLAARALTAAPRSTAATGAFVAAGLCAGAAAASKVSGVLLVVVLVATWLAPRVRASGHASTFAPWAGVAAAAVAFSPVVLFEAHHGWPMLRHRLLDTQGGAGVSLRNVGAVLGGQLAYVSPFLAFVAVLVAIDLVKRRREDAVSELLFRAMAIPGVALLALCLWSRVAEPHWLAPALLPLPIHAARVGVSTVKRASVRLVTGAAIFAAVCVAFVHAWVLVPGFSAALLPKSADPKLDIATELFGWPDAIAAVDEVVQEEMPRGEIVVVGPHWVVCAQLHAALGAGVPVGCATPVRDDFGDWRPRESWQHADKVLWVSDDRFADTDPTKVLPGHAIGRRGHVSVLRGGRLIRRFTLILFEARGAG